MFLLRLICVVYWVIVTFLLLTPDPLRLLGISLAAGPPGGRGLHFLLFALLALLTCAGRWPVRRRPLLGLLVTYAILSETLQAFVPNRTVELLDFAENLLGLIAGAAVWRLMDPKVRTPQHQEGG